jgi:Mrp family chromosome partitioning ATPase
MGNAGPQDILQTVQFHDLVTVNGAGPDASADGGISHSVVCITAGTPVHDPVEVFRSERFRTMLATVQRAYDLVILDTTPLLVVVDALELLPEVETIVMCVRASKTTRDELRAGREALERLPERPSGLVVTGITREADPGYEYYGYYS